VDAMAKGGQNDVLRVNGTWDPLLSHTTVALHDIFSFFCKGKQPVSSNFGAEWAKVYLSGSVYKVLKWLSVCCDMVVLTAGFRLV
jgi:hypothetical protein